MSNTTDRSAMGTAQGIHRREALRLAADPDVTCIVADALACVVLEHVNTGQRMGIVNSLREVGTRRDRLQRHASSPRDFSIPLPGEGDAAHRAREIDVAKGQIEAEIEDALSLDWQMAMGCVPGLVLVPAQRAGES